MSKIELEVIKPKRPAYMMDVDKRNIKIIATEEELMGYTIAEHNAPFVWVKKKNEDGEDVKVKMEHSNIPSVLSKVFKNTVMAQIMEPLDNALICVDINGTKVNTNEGDYDCSKCNHFVNDKTDELIKTKYNHGYCKFAIDKWIERFGSLDYRPEGLDDLQDKIRRIGEDKQVELTQEEVLQMTKGLSGDWVDDVRESISEPSDDIQDTIL
jgi:hypothetical protein